MRGLLPWILVALTPAATPAYALDGGGQDERELTKLEVSVTSAVDRSVFLDKGRDDGLLPGDHVRILPPGRAAVDAEVRSVASGSARAELSSDATIEPGTPGEVLVPTARLRDLEKEAAGEAPAEPSATPQHPPWTAPPESWSGSTPLLAPPKVRTAAERELKISGSTFLQVDGTIDRSGDTSRELLARAGADLSWENPFGRGGQLDLDLEALHRSVSFDGQSQNDSETRLRLQRFSYLWGGTREAPRSWQIGRFLQRGFPEFGLLDGVELTQRFGTAHRFGVTAGYLPEPNLDLTTGKDLEVAAYVRRDIVDGGGFGWGLGYQKTWHQGTADRDLLAGTIDWWPGHSFTLHGSALADVYTSGEKVNSPGVELTELHLFANWRIGQRTGASFNVDHVRVPDLLRNEYPVVTSTSTTTPPPPTLVGREFQRAGARVWRDLSRDLRVSARADLWRNSGDSGEGGEIGASWRNLLWDRGQVSASVFANQGRFSSIEGLRVGVDRDTDSGFWSLSWEAAKSQQEGLDGTPQDLLQQSVRASWDRSFGRAWSLSVYVEQLFGDSQDATTLGFYLQRRL